MKVKSIGEYIDLIKNNSYQNEKPVYADMNGLTQRTFFRGQSCNYGKTNNVASIFREQKNSGKEYSLTNEYMRRLSKTFNNLENNFARLTYMQHYGLPTRLIDVTTDALVALYFACQSNKVNGNEQDGVVNIFVSNSVSSDEKSKPIPTYFNSKSDTVEILSTLALMDEEKKSFIYDEIKKFQKKVLSIDNYSYDKFYMSKTNVLQGHSQDPEENEKMGEIAELYNELNGQYEIKCLYHDIKRDVGYFDEVIDFFNLLNPIFVEPLVNNERLRAQSGFFLFEPYESNKYNPELIHADISKRFGLEINGSKENQITIVGEKKKDILKDLDKLCEVNQASLFPDSSNIAEYVANSFLNE